MEIFNHVQIVKKQIIWRKIANLSQIHNAGTVNSLITLRKFVKLEEIKRNNKQK